MYKEYIIALLLIFQSTYSYAQLSTGGSSSTSGGTLNTGNTSGSTGSPLPVPNDSTILTQPKTGVKIFYLNNTSDTPVFNNSNLASIPDCPDPANVDLTYCNDMYTTPNPSCTVSGTGVRYCDCPDYCKALRNPEIVTPMIPNTTLVDYVNHPIQNAACPDNYHMVATYDMQQEVVWSDTAGAPYYPLTQAQLNAFLAFSGKTPGYSCGACDTTKCGPLYGATYSSSASCLSNMVTVGLPKEIVASGAGIFIGLPGMAKISGMATDPGWCITSTSPCAVVQADSTNPLNVFAFNCYKGVLPKAYVNYYQYYQCTPTAGAYLTTNKIPVGVICARDRSVWTQKY